MKRSELVLTLLAALVAATFGARGSLRFAPLPAGSARVSYATYVQPLASSDRRRTPERTKG